MSARTRDSWPPMRTTNELWLSHQVSPVIVFLIFYLDFPFQLWFDRKNRNFFEFSVKSQWWAERENVGSMASNEDDERTLALRSKQSHCFFHLLFRFNCDLTEKIGMSFNFLSNHSGERKNACSMASMNSMAKSPGKISLYLEKWKIYLVYSVCWPGFT